MLIENKLKVLIFLQNVIWSALASQQIEVIYAVNAGSNISHTDVDGIIYAKDDSKNYHDSWSNGLYHNVNPKDEIIYETYAWTYTKAEYNMPVKGDGKYWIILKNMEKYIATCPFGDCVFDAIINGNHTILSNYDIYAKAGGGDTAIDEFVYFEVCNDTLKYKNEISKINNSTITIAFQVKKGRARVRAIVLLKGDISLISKISRQNNTINPEYIEQEQNYYCESVVDAKDVPKEIQQNTKFIILLVTSLAITVAIVILDIGIVRMMTHQ
jgi:hypothetical protein